MDFGAMFQTWMNVLTHPNEQTFIDENNKPQAKLLTAIIWIMIAAVIVAIFSIFRVLISAAIGGGAGILEQIVLQFDLPPEAAEVMMQQAQGNLISGIIGGFCGALFGVPFSFLIGSGIYWLVAKLLGGNGSYEEQTYLLGTFTAPLMIVNGIISIIPIAGGCIAILISIYTLVLTYFALKVAHEFTSGKAIATLLIPLLIGILLGCCIIAGVIAMMSAVLGEASQF
jgi:hypothetical protein